MVMMATPLCPLVGTKETKEKSKKELPRDKQAIHQQRIFASGEASNSFRVRRVNILPNRLHNHIHHQTILLHLKHTEKKG
jgi:hypothetical protein